MTLDQVVSLDPAWAVPEANAQVLAPKCYRHALVIPVVNEGERIRAQLGRLHAQASPVDIVIADGGSTDGSLDVTFLASNGVNTLLTKLGPGRLSAQLRMAYAFVLARRLHRRYHRRRQRQG
jgi:dolichol-phosphate mannosyltransferase